MKGLSAPWTGLKSDLVPILFFSFQGHVIAVSTDSSLITYLFIASNEMVWNSRFFFIGLNKELEFVLSYGCHALSCTGILKYNHLAPIFRNLHDQQWEFSFEMGVQTLFTVIKTLLINLSVMQGKKQKNTEQDLCVATFVYNRDKR